MNKQDVIISQPRRSIWHRLIASFCYTVTIFLVGYFFYLLVYKSIIIVELFYLAGLFCSTALGFSVVQTFHFDYTLHKYKIVSSLGILCWGKWQDFKNNDTIYISIFKKGDDHYELKIFYDYNQKMPLYYFYEKQDALDVSKQLAQTAHLPLWDATDPHNGKWIDL